MSLVFTYPIQENGLKEMLSILGAVDLHLHLYTNNYSPNCDDTVPGSAFTEVSGDSSYSVQTLANGSWTVSTTSCVSTATYPSVTFNLANSQTIYGYYVTDASDTNNVYFEKFTGGPFAISAGGSMTITPNVQMGLCS